MAPHFSLSVFHVQHSVLCFGVDFLATTVHIYSATSLKHYMGTSKLDGIVGLKIRPFSYKLCKAMHTFSQCLFISTSGRLLPALCFFLNILFTFLGWWNSLLEAFIFWGYILNFQQILSLPCSFLDNNKPSGRVIHHKVSDQ